MKNAPAAHGPSVHATLDALQARYALRVTARLSEQAGDLAPDVTQRLRFAREQALARAQAARTAAAPVVAGRSAGGAAVVGWMGSGWGVKIASILPVVALAAGLLLIQHWQYRSQITVAADVDAALLADDLPPNAYSDVGFAEFLKASGQ